MFRGAQGGGASSWQQSAPRMTSQQYGQPEHAQQPAQAPASLFAPAQAPAQFQAPAAAPGPPNAFGMTAGQSQAGAGTWDQHTNEMNSIRQQMGVDAAAREKQRLGMFANDPRKYQGQSLYDIFSGSGASHGLPGAGSY